MLVDDIDEHEKFRVFLLALLQLIRRSDFFIRFPAVVPFVLLLAVELVAFLPILRWVLIVI